MFSVRFQHILWSATNPAAADLLAALADFAGLTPLDATTGIPVTAMTEAQLLAMAQTPGALSGYCTVWRQDGIGVLRGFDSEAQIKSGQLKALFYYGLLPYFSPENLPIHGALAGKNGKGILFLGQSGMGKSTTMARLQLAGWEIYADDAVLLHRACGIGLPTWSCGVTGAPQLFRSGARLQLGAVVELERGSPALTALTGVRCYSGLLRGFHDLFGQLDRGWPAAEQRRFRQMAMTLSGGLVKELPIYRLPLTLTDEFEFLLEKLL